MQNFHSAGEEQSRTSSHCSSDTVNLLKEHFIRQNFHLANAKERSNMGFSPLLF